MECSEPEDAHHFREQFRRQFGVARAVYDQLLDELRNVPGLQDGKTRTDAAGKQRGKREAKPLCIKLLVFLVWAGGRKKAELLCAHCVHFGLE